MARSVGNIEITVEADTSRLKVQLTRDAKKAARVAKLAAEQELRDINAVIDFHTEEAKTRAKILAKQIEAQLAGIPLDLDFTTARAELAGFREQAEKLRLVLDTSVELSEQDLAEIQADYGAWKKAVEADKVKVRFAADMAELLAGAEAVQRKLEQEEIDWRVSATESLFDAVVEAEAAALAIERREPMMRVGIDVDSAPALAKLEAQLLGFERTHDITLQAEIEQDRASLRTFLADMDLIQRDIGDFDARVAVAYDKAQKQRDVDDPIRQNLTQLGEDAGRDFGRSFGRGLSLQEKAIVGAVLAFSEPIVQIVEATAGVAAQLLGSAFQGLAGGVGAMTPIVAGLGASLAAIGIGSIGVGDAIGAVTEEFSKAAEEGREFNAAANEITDAMQGLGPAAREVVGAFALMFPQLRQIQMQISERLFAGLAQEMAELSQETIPDIGRSLTMAADSANRFGVGLSDALQGVDFTATFKVLQPALDAFGRAIIAVVSAIEPFLAAAAPAARELASWLEAGAESLASFLRSTAGASSLQRFLVDGVESLQEWTRLIGATAAALGTLFRAGAEGGDDMVASLTDIIGRWDDWMESVEGQEALAEFFATSREIMADLVPLLKGLGQGLQNIVTPRALGNFERLSENLGDILRVLGRVIGLFNRMDVVGTVAEAVGDFARALEEVMPSLEDMADTIGEILHGALVAVTPLIESLAEFVGFLADAFNSLGRPLQVAVVALGALFLLAPKMGGFVTNMGKMATAIDAVPKSAGKAAEALTQMAAGLLTFDFSFMRQGLAKLGPELATMAKGVAAGAGVALASGIGIAFGVQFAMESDSMIGKVEGFGAAITSALAGFAFGPVIGGLSLAIGGVITLLGQAAAEARKIAQESVAMAEAIAANFGEVKTFTDALADSFIEVEETSGRTLLAMQKLGLETSDLGDVLKALDQGGAGRVRFFENFLNSSDKIVGANEDVVATVADLIVAAEDYDSALQSLQGRQDTAALAAIEFMEANEGALRNLEQLDDAGEDFSLDKVIEATTDKLLAAEGGTDAWLQAVLELGPGAAEIDILNTAIGIYNEEAEAAAEATRRANIAIQQMKSDPIDSATQSYIAQGQAIEDARVEAEELLRVNERLALEVPKVNEAFRLMATPLSRMGRLGEGLAKVFDLGNAPMDALGDVADIQQGLRDLTEFINDDSEEGLKGAIPNIFNPDDINADDFLSKIEGLRDPIQEQIEGAFAAGGPEAAQATADNYISNLVEALGGKISRDEAIQLLGLDDLQTKIDVAVELALEEQVQQQLDALVGLQGEEDIFTVSIGMALSADAISPEAAEILIQAKLHGMGVLIPSELDTPDTAAAREEAAAWVAANGLEFPSELIPPLPLDPAALPTPPTYQIPVGVDPVAFQAALADAAALGINVQAPVVPKVNIPVGVDLTGVQGEVDAAAATLGTNATPVMIPSGVDLSGLTADLENVATVLGTNPVSVAVGLEGYEDVNGNLNDLQVQVTEFDDTSASASVKVPGVTLRTTEVKNLDEAIKKLSNKTVTITLRTVRTGDISGLAGTGIGGAMAGAMITRPRLMAVGERNYREAIVPLDLPLNRVDPSVRELAAMLRGGGAGTQPGIGRQVNNYMTITPQSADPGAVATQVLNRAAVLANR